MDGLPLHPAVVHLPLGLAFALPLVAIGLTVAYFRALLPQRAFGLLAGLQLLLCVSGLVAMQLGEQDEERLEEVVSEQRLDEHADAAYLFLIAGAATFLAAGGLLFLRQERVVRGAAVAVTLATLGVAALGLRAGHAGGELVYRFGAAASPAQVGAGAKERASEAPPARAGHDDDDDD